MIGQTNDLPPRTWRQWWSDLPGYWRIAGWAALVLVVLHLTLAARIAIGLRESSRITSLKARGGSVRYWWDELGSNANQLRYNRFPGHQLLIAGFYGRSPWNVTAIWMEGKAQDHDLQFIGIHFQSVRSLHFKRADISSEGACALRRCAQLEFVNLSQTDIDDDGLTCLVRLPRLVYLDVNRTLITEQAIPLLKQLPSPKQLNVEWTAASFVPIEAKRDLQTPFEQALRWTRKPGLLATIRWSDGKRSSQFEGDREFWIEGPVSNFQLLLDPPPVSREHSYFIEQENLFWWSKENFSQSVDGDYRFCLKLNGVAAEPVMVSIQSGIPTTDRIEFRMPVTKLDVMR